MKQNKAAIILAAGKGKRMKSDLPKVLHKIAGVTMIRRVVDSMIASGIDKIVVIVGHKGELVEQELSDYKVEFVWQKEQLGTGHAVMMAEKNFVDYDGDALVAAGDVPFLSIASINRLFEIHYDANASATCLSAIFEDPSGYGRIVRQPGTDCILEIVEDKDASDEIKKITEINSGTFCFKSIDLFASLKKIRNNNAQKEYYLTDTVKILSDEQKTCSVWPVPDPIEVYGVNSKEQLQELEKAARDKKMLD